MIALFAPDQLRPLDRVLVNGGFWTLLTAKRTPPAAGTRRWRLTLDHDGDELIIYRGDDARLTVDTVDR